MFFKILKLEIISCFSKFLSWKSFHVYQNFLFKILKADSTMPVQVSCYFEYLKNGKLIINRLMASCIIGIEGKILRDLIYFSVKLRKCI